MNDTIRFKIVAIFHLQRKIQNNAELRMRRYFLDFISVQITIHIPMFQISFLLLKPTFSIFNFYLSMSYILERKWIMLGCVHVCVIKNLYRSMYDIMWTRRDIQLYSISFIVSFVSMSSKCVYSSQAHIYIQDKSVLRRRVFDLFTCLFMTYIMSSVEKKFTFFYQHYNYNVIL